MDIFISKYGNNFRTDEAKKELVNLVERLAPKGIVAKAKERLQILLSYPTIKDFTDELYELAKKGKTKILGEKGRDSYLRDFGYWDRVPIDRHEMRFMIRTGIYHTCDVRDKSDPLQKETFHEALTIFCSKYLTSYEVHGIDLGIALGVVDIFIWSFCTKKRYNICGNIPKCDICVFKDVCLYKLLSTP